MKEEAEHQPLCIAEACWVKSFCKPGGRGDAQENFIHLSHLFSLFGAAQPTHAATCTLGQI